MSISYSQTDKEVDCKVLKNCKLLYIAEPSTTDYVVISNDKHTEYLQEGKYYIKSDLKWISDCEFNATMKEITLPDFPFKIGEIMNVKFEKIESEMVYGIITIQCEKFPVLFKLMK